MGGEEKESKSSTEEDVVEATEDQVPQIEPLGSVDKKSNHSTGRHQKRDRVNWLMHLLYTRGEYAECLRLIESQLQACDGLAEYPVFLKAMIKRHQGKIQESLELFQAATLLNPMNQENLKQVGRSLFLLGKHRAATDVLEEASIHSTHEDWEILHNKGLCFMYLKEYEQAERAFDQANAIQRHDTTFVELGKLYVAQGKFERAIKVFLEALEFSPENPDLLTTVGLLYLRTGENFKAFDYLGNSLTHDPRNPKTILAAGSIIQDHGDNDVALVKYRVAAVKRPNSAQLWNNVGMCFFGKQRYVAAVACLKRSLYLDPFQWITAHNLGLVFLNTGQYASAFHYLSASINLKSDFAASYMYLAIVLNRLEDPENAVAAYEKSIQLDPNPSCYLNYAATLHNLGRISDSKKQYNNYKRACETIDPEEVKSIKESSKSLINELYAIHEEQGKQED